MKTAVAAPAPDPLRQRLLAEIARLFTAVLRMRP